MSRKLGPVEEALIDAAMKHKRALLEEATREGTASEVRHLLKQQIAMRDELLYGTALDPEGYLVITTFRWGTPPWNKDAIDIEAIEVKEPKGLLPEKT